jgi:Raf kinase inhibitor-like YbhB/YbcL family protein
VIKKDTHERKKKMKKIILISFGLIFFVSGIVNAQGFTLKSDDLGGQLTDAQVYAGFGCSGKNISPSLKWSNAPANTKSFAVTVYDPDAPSGSGWWHWIIFNIPVNVNELKADAGRIEKKLAPAGSIQSITDFGSPGFGGACPPEGDKAHRYIFTVYALKTAKLELDEKASPAMVGFYLNNNTIAKASLIGYYQR